MRLIPLILGILIGGGQYALAHFVDSREIRSVILGVVIAFLLNAIMRATHRRATRLQTRAMVEGSPTLDRVMAEIELTRRQGTRALDPR